MLSERLLRNLQPDWAGLGPVRAWLALLLLVLCCCSRPKPAFAQSKNLDGFAQCLADKKVTMYGSFLCPHCDDQKKLFGPSFRFVPYVECTVRGSRLLTSHCVAEQIRFSPTWIFADGDRRLGLQPLKVLSEKTGCKLP